jgi:hypothetical protein
MSYEGRMQLLCKQGHYMEIDCYADEPKRCDCGAEWAKKNSVDDTNGEAAGYIEPTLLTEKKCTHCESVLAQTFTLEVVREEIEVGDVVSPYHCPSKRCTVIGIYDGVAYHQDSIRGEITADKVKSLSLIRKGPKEKVLWWDEWGKMPYNRAVDKIIQAYSELDPDDKHGVAVMLRRKA